MSFSTGTKTENAIFFAFGVVMGLAAVRLWAPELLADPANAIAASLFWGSLLGSLAFFLRLDRFVTWWIKVLTLRKYRKDLENHFIRIDIAFSIWQVLVTETWETPEEKADEKLSRLMEGPSLHNDIWSMKGAFYFTISLPFLFFVVDLITPLSVILIVSLWGFVIVLVLHNYRGFLLRCVQLASYLTMQETKSVVQLRKKHKSIVYPSGRIEPFSAEVVDTVLAELDIMTNRQDWRGFKRRMDYLLETFEQEVNSLQDSLPADYVRVWAEAISGRDEPSRLQSLVRTKVMKRILEYAVELECINSESTGISTLLSVSDSSLSNAGVLFKTVDGYGMSSSYQDSMYAAFYRKASPPVNSKIVEIVIKWYKEGHTSFADHLLSSIEYVDEELRENATRALLAHKEKSVWHKAGVQVVRSLLNLNDSRVESVKLLALKGGNKSVVSEILVHSDTQFYDLVKEVTSYITSEDTSLALSAIEFFMRIEEDLMVNNFLPSLFRETELSIRMNTITFLGRLWAIDNSLFSDDWKVKRDAYRAFLRIALDDDKPGVRRIAVDILKDLKPTDKELEVLEIIASDDPVDEIRYAAKKILKRR